MVLLAAILASLAATYAFFEADMASLAAFLASSMRSTGVVSCSADECLTVSCSKAILELQFFSLKVASVKVAA
jgi:hypothetical protein